MRRVLIAAALVAAALPAMAQDAVPAAPPPGIRFPHFNAEIDTSMIGAGTTRASDPARRGTSHAILGRRRYTGGL